MADLGVRWLRGRQLWRPRQCDDLRKRILPAGNGTNNTGGTSAVADPRCDTDWSTWWVGSRTQWNVSKDFYMGVDVLYLKLQSMSYNGATTIFVGPGLAADQDNLMFRFRVHRDFYP